MSSLSNKQIDLNHLVQRHSSKQLLVENRLTYTGPDSELSIYDTYHASSGVGLGAPQLLYCGMVQGKKIIHSALPEPVQTYNDGQVFLPHESFVMPPGDFVEIDFPEANEHQPTTCLTIEIPKERIETIAERMRDITLLDGADHDWQYQPQSLHTHHTSDTQQLLEKLVSLFTQNHPDKEMMMDLGVSELIIRLLRQQGREVLLSYCRTEPDASGVTAAIHFLVNNLVLPLDVEQLCRLACMSRSRLYVEFKKQVGCTPGEFQQQLRLQAAAKEIKNGHTITEACYNSGFNDLSHFSRRFTQFFGCSPTQFKTNLIA
jgi:AraC-like DNA-binding protein